MTSTLIDEKNLYLNVRTKTVVAVLDQDTEKATVATFVNNSVSGKARSVPLSSMHKSTLRSNGQPYTSGYVPVVQAISVADSPTPRSAMHSIDIDSLDGLSDEELTALAAEQAKVKSKAEAIVEKAKTILKSRRAPGTTLVVQGRYALVYKSGEKFDAKTALRNLSKEDYVRILRPKPDATHARKVFEKEPDKLALCLKDDGPSLTIREATEDDYAKVIADSVSLESSDEEFSFTV